LFQPFQCPCASLFNIPLPEAKASAKIQPFSKLPKFFFAFFQNINNHDWLTVSYKTKKIKKNSNRTKMQLKKAHNNTNKHKKRHKNTQK